MRVDSFLSADYIRFARSPVRVSPRERVTTEHLEIDDYSPREYSTREYSTRRETSRRRRDVEIIERDSFLRPQPTRKRSVSVHTLGRYSAPVQLVEPSSVQLVQPREYVERTISRPPRHSGDLVLVQPRNSEHEINKLEEELRLMRAERMGGIEITRQRETDIIDNKGNAEEVTEISRQERNRTFTHSSTSIRHRTM